MNANIHSGRCRQSFATPHALQPFEIVEESENSKQKNRFVTLKNTYQPLSALRPHQGWQSRINQSTLK